MPCLRLTTIAIISRPPLEPPMLKIIPVLMPFNKPVIIVAMNLSSGKASFISKNSKIDSPSENMPTDIKVKIKNLSESSRRPQINNKILQIKN